MLREWLDAFTRTASAEILRILRLPVERTFAHSTTVRVVASSSMPSRREVRLPQVILTFGALTLAGLTCLAMPFWGDQALFTVYGRVLSHGGVLYRDVFDLKQPGVFWFYALAGRIFGFTEVGIHLFELAYWMGFSAFALTAFRRYFSTPWGPALIPVFTIVVYYLYAALMDIAQIEILVAFPILLAWRLIQDRDRVSRNRLTRYAIGGIVASVVVLFKYLYVLIVFAFLGVAVFRSHRDGMTARDIGKALWVFAVGLVVPLLIVAGYFAVYGQLGRIWWAFVHLAPRASERDTSYLELGLRRFMIGHGALVILALLGCADAVRKRVRPKVELVVGMVLWLVVGAVTFVIQGWFEYKWVLFTVPLGILGVLGFEALLGITSNARNTRRWAILILGLIFAILAFSAAISSPHLQTLLLAFVGAGSLSAVAAELLIARVRVRDAAVVILVASLGVSFGVAVIKPAHKVVMLSRYDFGLTVEARTDLMRSWSQFYRDADRDLRVLGHALPSGPLEVFGSGVVLYRAGRPPATPFVAVRPEFYDERAWHELYADLQRAPPPCIFVDPYIGDVIDTRFQAITRFITSRYEIVLVGDSGTWYVDRVSEAKYRTSPELEEHRALHLLGWGEVRS